jgi:hypothetical protein
MVAKVRAWIADYFEFDAHDTTIQREALAGVTTFVTRCTGRSVRAAGRNRLPVPGIVATTGWLAVRRD